MSGLEVRYTLSRGRPKDPEIREAILATAAEMPSCTAEIIRQSVGTILIGKRPAWTTIHRHLEDLVREGRIRKHVLKHGKRRTMAVYTPL